MSDQANRLRELMSQQLTHTVPAAPLPVSAPVPAQRETAPPTPAAPHHEPVQPLNPAHHARVIVVTSGKGGVGKTNVTVNLALALAKREKKTILFDADLGMANVDVILGVSPKATLADVMHGTKRLDEILIPYDPYLSIVPGGSGIQQLADLDQTSLDRFTASLKQLEHQADFILVDTGAGISRAVLNFVLAASEILVVTTPEPTAITDAYGLIKSIDQHNRGAQVQLIINMVESESEARSVAQKLIMIVNRFLEVPVSYLTYVEKDPEVSRSVLMQKPFFLAFPYGPTTRRINVLAGLLIDPQEGQEPPRFRGSFFQRLSKIIR